MEASVPYGQQNWPVDDLLSERQTTHGSFCENAAFAQHLKQAFKANRHWTSMTAVQQEAIEFICSKFGRIMSGQPGFQDHWDDIAGYAQLVVREIKEGRY